MTKCSCPGCKQNLVTNDSRFWESWAGLVCYWCVCGTLSKWDFDVPVPVLREVVL